jgi:pimeloyl-ACP methyl ester carboxylesterase
MRVELLLGRAIMILAAAYTAAVGVLAIRETAIVYPGAGRTFRMLPGRETGVPWDTIRVRDADSVPVLLLESRLDTASGRPWVLYLHGNFGLLGARGNVARYRLLREAGFNVMTVEYRGFGHSEDAGKPNEKGIYADATAGWEFLTGARGVPPHRVVIYGHSLGGGPATHLAARYPAAALVTEGTSTSLPDVGADRYPWVPVRLIMRNRFASLKRAPSITMPWVVFHGRNDVTIPTEHGEALAAAAPQAQLVLLASDHEGGVVADRATAFPILRDLRLRLTPIDVAPQSAPAPAPR